MPGATAVDDLQKLVDAERLQEGRPNVAESRCVAVGGHSHHRNRAEGGVFELPITELPTVHHRHHEIEHNQRRMTLGTS